MKIFYIAFACEPNRTSEPGVGWHVAGEMVHRHDVTVLTRKNNQAVIETYLKEHPEVPQSRVKFLYFDLAGWWCRLKKRIPYGAQIYQETWNRAAAKRFQSEMQAADIVHQITFGAAFFTPYAAKSCPRFVWGPLGGGDVPVPYAFTRRMGIKSVVMEFLYGFATRYASKGNHWVNGYRHACKAIIFRMNDFARRMGSVAGQIHAVVPETAYEDEVQTRTYESGKRPLRVMMLGRLLPHKGVMLALEAFVSFVRKGGKGELVVCGSGVLKHNMERQIVRLGIGEQVKMMGQCPHDQVLQIMKDCDVMLHLSFREGGSWSILECMAHGLPVICQGKSGMDDMVADDCGTKIDANTPDQLIEEASRALLRYTDHPEGLAEQGQHAQERVKRVYRWEKIADRIDAVYHEVMK